MEDSSTQNDETIVGYNTYNPCYYFHLAARCVLKCLGLDDSPSAQEEDKKRNETSYDDNPPSSEEQGMKSSEDAEVTFSYTAIAIRRAPRRPPVGTGRPPENN
ncbi:hypothetical protein AQUCO_01400494v1 [Aquilegia coerulea]|uniref:Uncharacterized protein n=1 Tax=Aquilegia coerulea TaxID=218851 RepID=A0A2G5DWP2_AQUCA|nr:hypothetical protein AQUCO_01400494v1 [Aquilegia coerulea]